jgi:hypothetical protein
MRRATERERMQIAGMLRAYEQRLSSPETNRCVIVTRSEVAPQSGNSDGVQPSAWEFQTLVEGITVAREHGVILPANSVRFVWFNAIEGDEAAGVMEPRANPITVHLRRNQTKLELFETVIHECWHAHDRLQLGERYFDMPQAQREQRAESFAALVLGSDKSRW